MTIASLISSSQHTNHLACARFLINIGGIERREIGREEVRKFEKKKESGVRYSVEGLWSVLLYWKSVLGPLWVSSWVTGTVTWITKRDISASSAWMFHVKDTGALWEDDYLNNDSAISLVSKDHCLGVTVLRGSPNMYWHFGKDLRGLFCSCKVILCSKTWKRDSASVLGVKVPSREPGSIRNQWKWEAPPTPGQMCWWLSGLSKQFQTQGWYFSFWILFGIWVSLKYFLPLFFLVN